MTASTARNLVSDLGLYIETAKDIVAKGDYVSLNGLDTQVETLCNAILNLSAEEAKTYADDLDRLMMELTVLQRSFIESRDQLRGELDGLTRHKQASMAYKRQEHSSYSNPKSAEPTAPTE